MEANNWALPRWFDLIESRCVVLPRFQRHAAWSHGQVEGLVDTVLRGLPCGALLTLEKGDAEPFVYRSLETAPDRGERITHYLLDGQQRLTALWRALHNNYEDRTYFVRLSDDESPPRAGSERRYIRRDQRYPLWADDPAETWSRGLLPLDLLCPGHAGEQRADEWRAAASRGDARVELEIAGHISRCRTAVATFNIPLLSLPRSTDPETALDVFVQMNTSASPLSTYDIMVAQIEAATGTSLHVLVADLTAQVPSLSAYYPPSKLVLYVTSLMLDRPSSRAEQRGEKFARAVVEHFDDVMLGTKRAVEFLEEQGLFDEQRLPTDVVVPALAYLWTITPDGLDAEGRARSLMQRYLWRAFCTRRYESSTAQKVHADVRALSSLIRGTGTCEPPIFDDGDHPLPEIEEIESARWPVKRDRLARAVLAIALRSGARDFADGRSVSRESLKTREYHHLFPKDWLKKQGVPKEDIDRALNCALLTWRTNRNIAAKAPATYLAERLHNGTDDGTVLRERLESHGIPFDLVKAENYGEFIAARAIRVRDSMSFLCDPAMLAHTVDEAA